MFHSQKTVLGFFPKDFSQILLEKFEFATKNLYQKWFLFKTLLGKFESLILGKIPFWEKS